MFYIQRTSSNATLQSEPLKQKHSKKQSWGEKRAFSPLPPYPFPLSQHHNLHAVKSFCTSPLSCYIPKESVTKSATALLQTLAFLTIAPQLATASNTATQLLRCV